MSARERYEAAVPAAQRAGDRAQLSALAHAVDWLVVAVGNRWDRFALEFFVFPGLMGDDVDYSSSGEEEGEEADDDDVDRASLAERVEGLTLHDADGDVAMADD